MLLTIEIPTIIDSDNTYDPSNIRFTIGDRVIYVEIDEREFQIDKESFVAFARLLAQ